MIKDPYNDLIALIICIIVLLWSTTALSSDLDDKQKHTATIRMRAIVINPQQFGMPYSVWKDRDLVGTQGWYTLSCCRRENYHGVYYEQVQAKEYCLTSPIKEWVERGVCEIMEVY